MVPEMCEGLALFGPVRWCASTHSFHALECSGEVWAARRALFLPDTAGAVGGSIWSRRRGILCSKPEIKLDDKPASEAPATGAPKGKGTENGEGTVTKIPFWRLHALDESEKQVQRKWSTVFADTNSQK